MPSQNQAKVTVIGGEIGESIVIQTPQGKWGVVDNYSRSPRVPDTGRTVGFLKSKNVETLEFLCLTHPDYDHYRGMDTLLSSFSVKVFGIFNAWTDTELMSLARKDLAAKILSRGSGPSDLSKGSGWGRPNRADGKSFFRLWNKVLELEAVGKLRVVSLSEGTRLYEEKNSNETFTVSAISPCFKFRKMYEKRLAARFDEEGRYKPRQAPRLRDNLISVALRVCYGDSDILLGADLDSPGWSEVLRSPVVNDISCDLVKVSHHGSKNAINKAAYSQYVKEQKKPIGIIAPFWAQGLPEVESTTAMKNLCSSHYLTNTEIPFFDDQYQREQIERFCQEAVGDDAGMLEPLLRESGVRGIFKNTPNSTRDGSVAVALGKSGLIGSPICDGMAGLINRE